MPSFARDVRPLFTQEDIDHMLDVDPDLDLGDYQSVKDHADAIYQVLSSGAMPPGQPWPSSQVETFKNWMDQGFPQ
jgi:hypothetical protein